MFLYKMTTVVSRDCETQGIMDQNSHSHEWVQFHLSRGSSQKQVTYKNNDHFGIFPYFGWNPKLFYLINSMMLMELIVVYQRLLCPSGASQNRFLLASIVLWNQSKSFPIGYRLKWNYSFPYNSQRYYFTISGRILPLRERAIQ